MFSGLYSKKFDSSIKLEEISNSIPSIDSSKTRNGCLEYYGKESLYNKKIKISKCDTTVSLQKIIIVYNFSPNILSWIIGICLFPFGLLIFIITRNAKNDFENEINSKLS